MKSRDIRQKYLEFFKARGHKEIAAASLVPENDPTTLFTGSGMQPMVPYLLGEIHPEGSRIVDAQKVFRSQDIEEVGDNRHDTLFEMLGNWSLGDYFKEEQIKWIFEFQTKELGLDPNKVYISVFIGDEKNNLPKDIESVEIWKQVFSEVGIKTEDVELGTEKEASLKGMGSGRIFYYSGEKNWWSRSGKPDSMPVGEPGGPSSEMFYLFEDVPHDPKFGENCHPNCDCGRFAEIGNNVFMQYKKNKDGTFSKLPHNNVDYGGGLERLGMAANNQPDMFRNDLHFPIIERLTEELKVEYDQDPKITTALRIIADHIKAAAFLIKDGVVPSNKEQGYVLRRLIRRAAVKLHQLNGNLELLPKLVDPVIDIYQGTEYFQIGDWDGIRKVIEDEVRRFEVTLKKGLKEVEKIEKIDGKMAFDLYQTFGFPYELTEELFKEKGQIVDHSEFEKEFKKHQEQSRSASFGMFRGGLADQSEVTTKYHTTTHLLHQALRDVLGPQVFQKGSNITSERLRFDFSFDRKLTEEEVQKVETIINGKIKQDLKVDHLIISIEKAREMNAIGLFNDKYAKEVSVYGVGPGSDLEQQAFDQRARGGYYSLEFCGGPHVENTGSIGHIKIEKEEAVSAGVRRVRVVAVGT